MSTRFLGLFGAVVLLLLTVSCARAEPPGRPNTSAESIEQTKVAADSVPKADRALVVTADVTLRVANVDDAMAKIRAAIESEQGYIGKANVQGEHVEASATMDVRVPAARASALRATLRGLGEVTSESEAVEDVTEQRADLSARLNNARNEERRMLDIMNGRSGDISQVIVAEKEVSRVRETIERLEAEERTMAGRISLATIHVTLEAAPAAMAQSPSRSIARAWTSGMHAASSLALWLAMGVAASAPTLFPLALVALAVIVIARRRRVRSLA